MDEMDLPGSLDMSSVTGDDFSEEVEPRNGVLPFVSALIKTRVRGTAGRVASECSEGSERREGSRRRLVHRRQKEGRAL